MDSHQWHSPFFTRFSLAGLNFPRASITRLTLRISMNQFFLNYSGVFPQQQIQKVLLLLPYMSLVKLVLDASM